MDYNRTWCLKAQGCVQVGASSRKRNSYWICAGCSDKHRPWAKENLQGAHAWKLQHVECRHNTAAVPMIADLSDMTEEAQPARAPGLERMTLEELHKQQARDIGVALSTMHRIEGNMIAQYEMMQAHGEVQSNIGEMLKDVSDTIMAMKQSGEIGEKCHAILVNSMATKWNTETLIKATETMRTDLACLVTKMKKRNLISGGPEAEEKLAGMVILKNVQLVKKGIAFRAKYRYEQDSTGPCYKRLSPHLVVPHPRNRGGDAVRSMRTKQLTCFVAKEGCDPLEANNNAVAVIAPVPVIAPVLIII